MLALNVKRENIKIHVFDFVGKNWFYFEFILNLQAVVFYSEHVWAAEKCLDDHSIMVSQKGFTGYAAHVLLQWVTLDLHLVIDYSKMSFLVKICCVFSKKEKTLKDKARMQMKGKREMKSESSGSSVYSVPVKLATKCTSDEQTGTTHDLLIDTVSRYLWRILTTTQ